MIFNAQVNLPNIKQLIFCGNHLDILKQDEISKIFNSYDLCIFITDQTIFRNFNGILDDFSKFAKKSKVIKYSSNSARKNLFECVSLVDRLVIEGVTRNSCLIIMGGGTMGDLWGFVASIYMRGIDWIFIPTTMMSQVDGTIGKIAVNGGDRKNVVGSVLSNSLAK